MKHSIGMCSERWYWRDGAGESVGRQQWGHRIENRLVDRVGEGENWTN